MMIAGVLLAVWLYNSSYQESVAKGNTLKEIKAQIGAVNEGNAEGDLNALKADEARLTDENPADSRRGLFMSFMRFMGTKP